MENNQPYKSEKKIIAGILVGYLGIHKFYLGYTKEELGEVLLSIGWKENIRGEALTIEEIAQLSNIISSRR